MDQSSAVSAHPSLTRLVSPVMRFRVMDIDKSAMYIAVLICGIAWSKTSCALFDLWTRVLQHDWSHTAFPLRIVQCSHMTVPYTCLREGRRGCLKKPPHASDLPLADIVPSARWCYLSWVICLDLKAARTSNLRCWLLTRDLQAWTAHYLHVRITARYGSAKM